MFQSTLPAIVIPDQNLLQFVLEQDDSHYDLDKPIFIDAANVARHYSLSSLRSTARYLGRGLETVLQVKSGDVVAIFSPNSIEYPIAIFGTFCAGATVTLINPVYKRDEVASQLKNSKASVVFTTNELSSTALEACLLAGIDVERVIVTDHLLSTSTTSFSDIIDAGRQENTERIVEVLPESTAFLCYSSGTTGLPKAVQLSHRNVVANLLQWDAAETRLDREASLISVLPFSHIYALSVLIMNPIRRMMSSYVMARFVPIQFMQLVQRHRITASFIVPPIVKMLLSDAAAEFDLSSLSFLCSGAAPLAASMARELCKRYSLPISQGYGMTETAPVLCYASFDGNEYAGSIGRLLPDVTMRIVDKDDVEQGAGGVGELQVKGPNVMSGYLENDEANADVFTKDGFFRTGDLGYVDSQGFVYIVDRLKELIKYKGFQVPPVELENLLLAHPAIQDCAVVGRSCDVEVTELPTAYCVLKPSMRADSSQLGLPVGWSDPDQSMAVSQENIAKDIMQFIASKVANFKKLRGGVVFVDSIPRLPAGKILRRMLRDRVGVQFILE